MFSFYATIIYNEREEGDQARVVGREKERREDIKSINIVLY